MQKIMRCNVLANLRNTEGIQYAENNPIFNGNNGIKHEFHWVFDSC